MEPVVELAEYALAVWRVSRMLVREDGPQRVFVKLREASGIEHDNRGIPYLRKNDWTPLDCVWCASMWVAPVVLVLPRFVRRAMAAGALTGLLDRHVDG